MASFGQESTARPAASRTGRWSEFTRQVKQAGLLDRRRDWYAAKIGLNLVLLAAGWVAFAIIGESWWQLVTARRVQKLGSGRLPATSVEAWVGTVTLP